MWSSILFAACLWLIAAGLALFHVKSWRAALHQTSSEGERVFYLRQYRRRLQISILIALVGCAVLAVLWIESTFWEAAVWSLLILVVLYIVGLAFVDAIQAQRHYSDSFRRTRREHQVELQRLLDKLRSENNGHS